MSSLSTRLTLAVVGITAGTVLVAGIGMWMSLQAMLMADIDRELDGRAERMRRFDGMTVRVGWRPPRPPEEQPGERSERPPERHERGGESRRLHQALAPDGRELGRSSALAAGVSLLPPAGMPADGQRTTLRLADGSRARVLAVAMKRLPFFLGPPPEPPPDAVVLLLGADLVEVDAELARMAKALGVLLLVATVLAAVSALLLRRAVLRPLARLKCELGKLRPDELSARIPDTVGPDEARVLVSRLNALLAGLEEAFKREQATIANIAHELRTPVAGLRSDIEFRLLAAADPAESTNLRSLLSTVTRMQAMVGNILMLARIEAGRERLASEALDLVPLIEAAIERWEPRAMARGLAIESDLPTALTVQGSAVHLDVLLDNLLGNAVAHGLPGAPVAVGLRVEGGALLTVVNACGAGIDPARLGMAFYRADDARSDGAHCGLGLALCRRIAGLSGLDLTLEVVEGHFTARLRWAAASAR